jgi:ABC-type multidrug transport system fused ATPase/permease subunit
MKAVLALFFKYLPRKQRLLSLVIMLLLVPLSTYLFILGSEKTREFGTIVSQGNTRGAAVTALVALPIMSSAFGVSSLLSRFVAGLCVGAAGNMRSDLFRLFSWAPPMSVDPRKAEGGLTSRTSDLERAWTEGARPLLLAVTNGISYIVMASVIDWWAALCMAVLALFFSSLVELTLGKRRVESQSIARDRQSAWDRWGRFLARAFGQRLLAMRDRSFEQLRGQKYNQKRLEKTNEENTYRTLGDWAVQSGSFVTTVATQLVYIIHQHALHQGIAPGAMLVLASAVALFQTMLNQGAQGLSTLRKGEVSLPHIRAILALRPLATEAQQRAATLEAQAAELKLQSGKPLVPPTTITFADVVVNDSGGQRILDIPYCRLEPGSFGILVGPSASGKSSLLAQMTGRLHPNQDDHLKQGLRSKGVVVCNGEASGWQYLSASLIEGEGRWLSLTAPEQSDTIRTFLQSARADLLPRDGETEIERKEKEKELLDALREVGLLDVVRDRLDDPLNGNSLTRQQLALLSLAQVSLLPAWKRSILVLDETFFAGKLVEDEKGRQRAVRMLRKWNEHGSTIIVAEDTWDRVPRELLTPSRGRKRSQLHCFELSNGTLAQVPVPASPARKP